MHTHHLDVRRTLDENVFLLKVLNLEFRENMNMEIDPGFNPYIEKHDNPLLLSLYKSYMTHENGNFHFVGPTDSRPSRLRGVFLGNQRCSTSKSPW